MVRSIREGGWKASFVGKNKVRSQSSVMLICHCILIFLLHFLCLFHDSTNFEEVISKGVIFLCLLARLIIGKTVELSLSNNLYSKMTIYTCPVSFLFSTKLANTMWIQTELIANMQESIYALLLRETTE